MARGSRHPTPLRKAIDLTNVIEVSEKDDLVNLLHGATERVAKQLTHPFDFNPKLPLTSPTTSTPTTSTSSTSTLVTPAAKPSADTLKPSTDAKSGPVLRDYTNGPRGTSISPDSAPETQLSELKRELLIHFRKWQANILLRVRDLHVSVPSDVSGSTTPLSAEIRSAAPPARTSRRGGRSIRAKIMEISNEPPKVPVSSSVCAVPSRHVVDPALVTRFCPLPTSLWQLGGQKRMLLLHIAHLLLLSTEEYSAFARETLLYVTSSLNLTLATFEDNELRLAKALGTMAAQVAENQRLQEIAGEIRSQRRIKANLASPAPTISTENIPTSEELAIQLVSHGLGTAPGGSKLGATITIDLLGPVAEHGIVIGSFFGVFSAKLSGRVLETYMRDIPDFAFVPVRGQIQGELKDTRHISLEDRRMQLTIAISGWVKDKCYVHTPWKSIGNTSEIFSIQWELGALMTLSSALENATKSLSWAKAKAEIQHRPVFDLLVEGDWPLSLTKINKIIDNPWSVGMVRADKLGLVLADTIQRRVHGSRPVNLFGFSLGARAIYSCLMALAERRHFGLINSVVLMGAPIPSDIQVWLALRSVLVGRLVNTYSTDDYLLAFLYRSSSMQYGVAGLQPIERVPGVENVDVGVLPGGHFRYQYMVGSVLQSLGWSDVNEEALAEETEALAAFDAKYGVKDVAETQSFDSQESSPTSSIHIVSSSASSFSESMTTDTSVEEEDERRSTETSTVITTSVSKTTTSSTTTQVTTRRKRGGRQERARGVGAGPRNDGRSSSIHEQSDFVYTKEEEKKKVLSFDQWFNSYRDAKKKAEGRPVSPLRQDTTVRRDSGATRGGGGGGGEGERNQYRESDPRRGEETGGRSRGRTVPRSFGEVDSRQNREAPTDRYRNAPRREYGDYEYQGNPPRRDTGRPQNARSNYTTFREESYESCEGMRRGLGRSDGRSEQGHFDQGRPEQGRPEQGRPEQGRFEPEYPDRGPNRGHRQGNNNSNGNGNTNGRGKPARQYMNEGSHASSHGSQVTNTRRPRPDRNMTQA